MLKPDTCTHVPDYPCQELTRLSLNWYVRKRQKWLRLKMDAENAALRTSQSFGQKKRQRKAPTSQAVQTQRIDAGCRDIAQQAAGRAAYLSASIPVNGLHSRPQQKLTAVRRMAVRFRRSPACPLAKYPDKFTAAVWDKRSAPPPCPTIAAPVSIVAS